MRSFFKVGIPSVFALLATVLLGCNMRKATAEKDASPLVAEVAGERITLRDLDKAIGGELYRLRAESLHQLVTMRAERLAAAKRGLSIKDYRAQMVDARVPDPSEDELKAALERAKAAGSVPPDTELSSVRRELSNFLTLDKRREAKEEYVDSLYLEHGVHFELDALGRGKVPLSEDGPSVGPRDAAVTIVEYTDFKSEFGMMGNRTVRQVRESYPDDVRFVFKQKPEPGDELSARAAEAALCANDQGKYWEYRQALFENPGRLGLDSFAGFARNLALDLAPFQRCIDERKHKAKVEADADEARRYGMIGTPAFALNGTPLSGAHAFRMFRRLIEVELGPKQRTRESKKPTSEAKSRVL